jgi:hypothetical protein
MIQAFIEALIDVDGQTQLGRERGRRFLRSL